MSYQYMSGMGRLVVDFPSQPARWYGTFNDCKAHGGAISWTSPETKLIGPIGSRVQINAFGESPLNDCYTSGRTRKEVKASVAPGSGWSLIESIEASMFTSKERCCYPTNFMQQKQSERNREMIEYQAALDAYDQAVALHQMETETVPPVTNGNGAIVTNGTVPANGNGVAVVVEEEKKYFGFTAQQLMVMGAGGLVLYMLLKK